MLVNFVQLPSFFILSLCLSPYFSLMPSPSCLLHLTLHPIPRTRLQVEAPRLRRNLTPYLLPPMLFFFQSFQLSISVIPAWTHEPPQVYSGLVELSLLSPPLVPTTPFPPVRVPSFLSQSPLIPSRPFFPSRLCPSHGES